MATLNVGKPSAPPFTVDDLSKDIRLRYLNSRGVASERTVTVHHLCGHLRSDGTLSLELVRGYCHTRKMPRTFHAERIQGLYDPESGEVIADVLKWAEVSPH